MFSVIKPRTSFSSPTIRITKSTTFNTPINKNNISKKPSPVIYSKSVFRSFSVYFLLIFILLSTTSVLSQVNYDSSTTKTTSISSAPSSSSSSSSSSAATPSLSFSSISFSSSTPSGKRTTRSSDSESGSEASKKNISLPESSAYLFEFDKNFNPKYNGTFLPRNKLNLTEAAKKIHPRDPDLYSPGDGPEDDDDENAKNPVESDKNLLSESSSPTTTTSTSTTTSTTTEIPSSMSATEKSDDPKGLPESSAYLFEFGPDFKPKYNGTFVPRHKLNLTAAAKKVYPKNPDLYDSGEGPEDDEDEEQPVEADKAPSTTSSTTTTTSTTTSTTTEASFAGLPKSSSYLFEFGSDFKPKYNGSFVPRHKLNLTEAAKKVYPKEPDYYEPGDGPEDEDEDDDVPSDQLVDVLNQREKSSTTTTTSTTSTTTESSTSTSDFKGLPKSSSYLFEFGPDFKPKYNGTFVPRHKLNLTEAAKKVYPKEPDYYEPGDGPEDDDGDDDVPTDQIVDVLNQREQSSTTTTTTTSTTAASVDTSVDEEEETDIDKAVGGISGIAQKIIQGPKMGEINNRSTPEEIYSYLGSVVRDEASKAIKATIPKIYDYQYPIGELVSQRCFNSFAQFGDRVRKGYVWPMKMVTSSSMGLSRFSFRDYGNFDSCLNVIADDDERKRQEQFFTGQYCMAKIHLPLPKRKAGMNYKSQIFNFNDTEIGGTFADFISSYGPFLYSNPVSFGMCLPSSCLPYEVEDVFNFFLKRWQLKIELGQDCYSKVNLTVTAFPGEMFDLKIQDLLEKENQKTFLDKLQATDSIQFWSIMYIFTSVVLVICATIMEHYKTNRQCPKSWTSTERFRPKSFFSSFSLIHNYRNIYTAPQRHLQPMVTSRSVEPIYSRNDNTAGIFPRSAATTATASSATSSSSSSGSASGLMTGLSVIDISVLDVFKTLGLFWLCLANFFWLGFQPQILPSVANVREIILSLRESIIFQFISQFWLSVDLFFMISGFLFAFTAVPYISRRDGRPSLVYFIARRVIRLLPSMIALMCALSLLPLWKNAGPMWNSGLKNILSPCQKFHWHNIFFISNLYNTNQTCLPHLWHLSMDFQLTVLALFITIFAYNRQKHAGKAFILLSALGVIYSGAKAYTANVRISAPIHQQSFLDDIPETIRVVHFSTPVHFTAYFIGLALGFYSRLGVLRKTIFSTPKVIGKLLWIVLPLLTLFAIYLPMFWPFKPRFKSERSSTALYYAVYRVLFIGMFVWIVNCALQTRSRAFKRFCSISVFRLLSALSLQIYLFNVIVVSVYLFTKRTIINDSLFDSLSVAVCLFLITVILSLFTYFLFEAPYRSLYRYYFESPRVLSLISPTLQLNGHPKAYHNSNLNGSNHRSSLSGPNQHGRIAVNGIAPNGNANNAGKKIHSREMNPNFLFSPHYNLVTNVSSRAESETNSLSNFQMDGVGVGAAVIGNGTVPGNGSVNYSQHPDPDRSDIVKYPSTSMSTLTAVSCDSIVSGDNRVQHDDDHHHHDLNNNAGPTSAHGRTQNAVAPDIVVEP